MKVLSTAAVLTFMGTAAQAQSCDASYPLGWWINEHPGEGTVAFSVDVNVNRVTEADPVRGGRKGCGSIVVTDNKTEKTIYEGQLRYAGKGLNEDGAGNGIYYFDVLTKQGYVDKTGLRKTADGLEIVSLTGSMAKHPFVKEKCFLGPINGTWTPVGIESYTMKELLDDLGNALDDFDKDRAKERTRGFGNVKQYIAAHDKLTEGKAIVSSNTTASAPAGTAETVCPLTGDWYGYLGNKGWGECAVYLQLLRTIDSNTYEFTVQLKVGKQVNKGKMQIKRNGDKIVMTRSSRG